MTGMKARLLSGLAWAPLLPAAAYYGVIFFLSSRSRLPEGPAFPLSDKLIHGLTFAGFALLLLWGFRRVLTARPAAAWQAAAVVGILGGILDEVHQLFVPLRQADPADALADAAGVLAVLAFGLRRVRSRGGDADAPRSGMRREEGDGAPAVRLSGRRCGRSRRRRSRTSG